MISFENDYAEGAHPKLIEALANTNLEQLPGYGTDAWCDRAKAKIRGACAAPEADIFFLTGGTQTNQIVCAALLKSYEGVIAAETGHVNLHEAGAIEVSGHKVFPLPHHEGKLDPAEVRTFLDNFYGDANHEHMPFPGMVYISWPTEYGTLYSKAELEALHQVCADHAIPLYVDGARLGYGLASREADLTLSELAKLCDVFYIGGTKVGALMGEALVFPKGNAPAHFITIMKQHGALPAKGRLLGVQFDALFTDGLYFDLGRHGIETAERLKAILRKKGCEFCLESPTNQQFVILENDRMAELRKHVAFSFWEKYDEGHTVIRFATSWATTEENLSCLEGLL